MTNRMTAEQIEAIRKRAEAATEGSWYYVFADGINVMTETSTILDSEVGVIRYPDAEFISAARTDIPALLAEVERLRKELNGDGLLTLQDQVDHARDYIAELIKKYDDMTSIALWSARRVHKSHKDFAYDAIEANTGEEAKRL